MRAFLWLLAVSAALVAGCGYGQKKPAGAPPSLYGAVVTVKGTTPVAALSSAPEDFLGQAIRIEGVVAAVCQGSGCWAEVRGADGATFMTRSLDHSVLVPTDCVGRAIVVQGVVTALPAEIAEEPAPEDHECPRPSYLVATQGVELR